MLATSVSRSGSIKSQLVDVFVSIEDMLSCICEMGEIGAFGNCTAVAGCGFTVPCVQPAQLLGLANGLLDVEGICVVLAGAVLAPACELGLANGDARSTAFSS